MTGPPVVLQDVTVTYRPRRQARPVVALDGVSLVAERGSTVALVGRSGAGKTTIARLLFGLARPSSGLVRVLDTDVSTAGSATIRALRRRMHMVFQDPYQSIHHGFTVGEVVSEPLVIAGKTSKAERATATRQALEDVGLTPASSYVDRLPATLSGGQRQRVALARALVAGPEVIVADEPASMLDASLRVSILELLRDLRDRHDAALIYITHDLAMARHISDEIVVMDDGRVAEHGATEQVLAAPTSAATRELMAAARAMTGATSRLTVDDQDVHSPPEGTKP
jgi:ABC-type glutathione transport system ATPase component